MKAEHTYDMSYKEKCKHHGYIASNTISKAVLSTPSGSEKRAKVMEPFVILPVRRRKGGAK